MRRGASVRRILGVAPLRAAKRQNVTWFSPTIDVNVTSTVPHSVLALGGLERLRTFLWWRPGGSRMGCGSQGRYVTANAREQAYALSTPASWPFRPFLQSVASSCELCAHPCRTSAGEYIYSRFPSFLRPPCGRRDGASYCDPTAVPCVRGSGGVGGLAFFVRFRCRGAWWRSVKLRSI